MKEFIKTTLIGGVLYLVPLALVVLVLGKLFGVLTAFTAPLAEALRLHEILGGYGSRVLAVLVLVAACFIAGLFARTGVARQLMAWLEAKVLSLLPGYSLVASLSDTLTHTNAHGGSAPSVVLARIEDAWQVALLVETIDANHAAVYVPGVPNPTSGSVYILTNDRLKAVDISLPEAMKCLKGLGIGTREMLQKARVTDL